MIPPPLSDRGLRIAGTSHGRARHNRKSRNRKAKSSLLGVALLITGMALAALPNPTTPTPTPTPRPRLTGGFGRPAATPNVSGGNGQAFSDVVRAASEAKTRKEPKPSVAITNDNLVTDPKKGRLTTAAPRSAPPTPGKPVVGATPTPAPPPAVPSEGSEAEGRAKVRVAHHPGHEREARACQTPRDA